MMDVGMRSEIVRLNTVCAKWVDRCEVTIQVREGGRQQ